MTKRWILAAALLLPLGCSKGDPKDAQVKEAVSRAQRLINRTRSDMASAMAFGSMREQGAGVVDYIAASLPDKADFTCYVWGPPQRPYCVSLRQGVDADQFVIEGYGAKLDQPIVMETATAGAPRRGQPAP